MAVQEFIATIDSYMNQPSPDTNYGSDTNLMCDVGYISGNKNFLRRMIGNFNISSLSGFTINSASLKFPYANVYGSGPTAWVERCTRPADWVEDEVTWDDYKLSTAWTSGGGDMDSSTPARVSFSVPTVDGEFSVTGLVNFATDALNNRSGIVSIIVHLDNENPGSNQGFEGRTREHSSAADRWRFVVDYTPAAAADRRRGVAQVI